MIINDAARETDQSNGMKMMEMIGNKAELGSYEKLSITKVTVDEYDSDQKHYHKRSDELYYVIKGSCTLVICDIPYLLQEGKCILVEHGEPHFIRSLGSRAELIVVCSPAWDENDCFNV